MIVDTIAAILFTIDRIVINYWTSAPQGGRVLSLFLFAFAIYLAGELRGEDNEKRRRRRNRRNHNRRG